MKKSVFSREIIGFQNMYRQEHHRKHYYCLHNISRWIYRYYLSISFSVEYSREHKKNANPKEYSSHIFFFHSAFECSQRYGQVWNLLTDDTAILCCVFVLSWSDMVFPAGKYMFLKLINSYNLKNMQKRCWCMAETSYGRFDMICRPEAKRFASLRGCSTAFFLRAPKGAFWILLF